MGISGVFDDVDDRVFISFAERQGIPYARRVCAEVKRAIAMWPDFAGRAGLSAAATEEIQAYLSGK